VLHAVSPTDKTDIEINLVLRDVRDRGRDIEGIIKQWFAFVKPSYTKYVDAQRQVSGMKLNHFYLVPSYIKANSIPPDIIIPRGIENLTAIGRWSRDTLPSLALILTLSRYGRQAHSTKAPREV
jgi:hypothetical protein